MKRWLKFVRIICFFIPLIIGMFGFFIVGQESFLDALFNSILLYVLGYSIHPANIWIEIARWTAPLMTASGVVLFFNQIKETLRQFFVYLSGKSIAVYGTDGTNEELVKQLHLYSLAMSDSFIKASRYLLLDTEENNFDLYEKYKKELKDKQVYIKCTSLSPLSIHNQNIHLFCAEEIAARLYWKSNFLYPLSKEKNHQLRIVMIGWNKLAEEVLLSSLQNNLFSADQRFTYQILGDGDEFVGKHTSLNDLTDALEFINEPWYQHLDLIEHADLVLLCEQENQVKLVNDLLFSTLRKEIHVFASRMNELQLLSGAQRLILFDWQSESFQSDYIFKDTLYRRAKKINLRYAHLYSNAAETEEQMELEWMKLDAFTRGSNVSSADYHEVRCRMLKEEHLSETDLFEQPHLELYSELEHLRWQRYHTLNNWKYGIPANGKNKDASQRIHSLLVQYDTLSEAEKEKDRENLRVLHSIQ